MLNELAAKLVRCEAWTSGRIGWRAGMQAVKDATVESPDGSEPLRCVVADDEGVLWCGHTGDAFESDSRVAPLWLDSSAVPDLTDRATVMLLLDLVREAWGDEGAFVSPSITWSGAWSVWMGSAARVAGRGTTEVEAIVAALVAAPC